MTTEKEKDEPNWKNILLFKCPHRNSCGDDIRNEENGNIIICCGDDLGGFNNEFAQCSKCRERDYGEFIDGLLGDAYEAGKVEAINREISMQCLNCGVSLHREIMDKKIHIHLCRRCRIKYLEEQSSGELAKEQETTE